MFQRLRFLSLTIFLSLLVLSYTSLCSAYQNEINRITGNWYDCDGNLYMTVKDNAINGCPIIKVSNSVSGGAATFLIKEKTGYRNMRIGWMGEQRRRFLVIVDSKLTLRSTPQVEFYESIDGLFLGMSKKEVINRYGYPSPTKINTSADDRWYYKDKGVEIRFDGGDMVVLIRLLKDSNLHLDKSGLNCKSPKQLFWEKYASSSSKDRLEIGVGEYLFIDELPNSLALTIHPY